MTKNTTLPKGIKSSPLALLAAGLLCVGFAQAQQSVNSSGGNATGSGGTVSYSIGQVVYSFNAGNVGSVAQGVQHSFEILPVGIKEKSLNISLTIFPNPTTENLILQANNYSNEKLLYQLLDIQGKQLSTGQIIAQQTQINTASLSNATYFINVINQENQKLQSFKIIKN
jgi:hypothetical protein